MNKKQLLIRLLKIDRANKKIYNFMLNDFTKPRWKNAAKKNGYKLLQLKKYKLCACFFLLAERLEDCLQIILEKFQDVQLALLICKFKEKGPKKPLFEKIVREKFIDGGYTNQDPWLTSIGHALLKEYVKCVNCLYSYKQTHLNIDIYGESDEQRLS